MADRGSGTTQDDAEVTCFVIGPIGDEHAAAGSQERQNYEDALQVFQRVIRPACTALGLQPVRADKIATPGEITEQICRHLRDDQIIIADVTDANANVMYELGLRHSRNLLTIPIGEEKRRSRARTSQPTTLCVATSGKSGRGSRRPSARTCHPQDA